MSLTSRHVAALVVAAIFSGVGIWYSYLILYPPPGFEPTLASWLLFFTAIFFSLLTYLAHQKKVRKSMGTTEGTGVGGDLITNTMNATDAVSIGIPILCLVLFGQNVRFGFTAFELSCFGAAGITIVYYLVRRDAWTANLVANGILTIGYFPMFGRLWYADHNTESFYTWGLAWVGTMVALYNPYKARDVLAGIYAGRAFIMVAALLALMARAEFMR